MLYITISYKSTYICAKLTSGDGNVRIAVIMFSGAPRYPQKKYLQR